MEKGTKFEPVRGGGVINPPHTIVMTTSAGEWVHHVDKDGKPAGGNYYGTEYEGGVGNLFNDEPDPWFDERKAAIAALRLVCAKIGDNDWPDDLHLADIIEKHLAEYLR